MDSRPFRAPELLKLQFAAVAVAVAVAAILVTEATDPDWVPIMKEAAGIVTDHGGTTSHAAIVSRELGVPAIVGAGRATRLITNGQAITISCAEGDEGFVYDGELTFEAVEVDLGGLAETRTDIMLRPVASPAAVLAPKAIRMSGPVQDGYLLRP